MSCWCARRSASRPGRLGGRAADRPDRDGTGQGAGRRREPALARRAGGRRLRRRAGRAAPPRRPVRGHRGPGPVRDRALPLGGTARLPPGADDRRDRPPGAARHRRPHRLRRRTRRPRRRRGDGRRHGVLGAGRGGGDRPFAVVRAIVDTPGRPLVSPATLTGGTAALRRCGRSARPCANGRTPPGPAACSSPARARSAPAVERAIEIVERALDLHGPPVYVRKQIVHNTHVVDDLSRRGAVFVDELDEVPPGSVTVFSAHGVAPAVRDEAGRLGLRVVDATCPLVSKVHAEARRFAASGHLVALIGHAGHEEVEGTLGRRRPRPSWSRRRTTPRRRCTAYRRLPPRPPSPPTRRARWRPPSPAGSRTRSARTRATSATPPPTGRRPSWASPAAATSCSSSARPTRPTPAASSRWPSRTARRRC